MLNKKTTLAVSTAALALTLATTASTQTPAAPAPAASGQHGPDRAVRMLARRPREGRPALQGLRRPVLGKYMAEGKILTWGLLGAYVAGPVNRTIYVWGKDPVSLMQARAAYLPEIMKSPGYAELGRLCPRQQVTLNNMVLTPTSK